MAALRSFALVTGTSSGIGASLARDLLGRGWSVAGISRRAAAIEAPGYIHLRLDLADLAATTAALETTIRPILADPDVRRIGLVNNAALVGLLGPVDQIDPVELLNVYAVNTTVPILLMGWFLRHLRPDVPLRIVNVSTGAAVTPLPGLGAYGSSKAALRLAGMILAAELDGRSAGTAGPDVSILSYEPGLVDTPMQATIRSSSAEIMPMIQVFQDWAATGALAPPSAPAARIADYLEEDGHPRWSELRFDPAAGDKTAG
ncbi:MAG: SDR family NAD(P)-dependent oxidoreductase [Gemmatimonadales bacterium]